MMWNCCCTNFLYHQHDKKQNGNTNTDKTNLFRQSGFFSLFSLVFFTFANIYCLIVIE